MGQIHRARKLDELRVQHLTTAFEDIAERNDLIRRGKIKARQTGPSAMQRMRAMLRSCLGDALREGLVTVNVATLVKLPTGRPPKAQVWTRAREKAWRDAMAGLVTDGRTGKQARREAPTPSTVMVWTAVHLGQFLDAVDGRPALCAVARPRHPRATSRRSPRPAGGMTWTGSTALDHRAPAGERRRQGHGGPAQVGCRWTRDRARHGGVAVLKAHRTAQAKERLMWGEAYHRRPGIHQRARARPRSVVAHQAVRTPGRGARPSPDTTARRAPHRRQPHDRVGLRPQDCASDPWTLGPQTDARGVRLVYRGSGTVLR